MSKDLGLYPNDHSYDIVCTAGNAHSEVSRALEELQPFLYGLSIVDCLTSVSEAIEKALSLMNGYCISSRPLNETGRFRGNDSENGKGDADQEDEFDNSTWEDFLSQGDDEGRLHSNVDHLQILADLRRDLRSVKAAGFKVGYLGTLTGYLIVSVAYRIAKLRLSEETMIAWNTDPRQYLILLLRYPDHYINLKQILQARRSHSERLIGFRVALCDSYKPSLATCHRIFNLTLKSEDMGEMFDQEMSPKLSSLFIGESLQALLDERFIDILKARIDHGFSWTEAEIYFNNSQGQDLRSIMPLSYKTASTVQNSHSTISEILFADHLSASGNTSEEYHSFPLIAMQFTLRHFARCTEFCLVCHCKIEACFEALKPYVCSKPLCLYQYMSLGFGPSLDWEIISQPYVVDLLVSFTFSAAVKYRLKDFPTGLGFKVPNYDGLPLWGTGTQPGIFHPSYNKQTHDGKAENSSQSPQYSASLNSKTMELNLSGSQQQRPPLRVGDWIFVTFCVSNSTPAHEDQWHCRVQTLPGWPVIKLDEPVICVPPHGTQQVIKENQPVEFGIYDTNFDNIGPTRKQALIAMLLWTLPDVHTMRSYLTSNEASSKRSLSRWKSRISPAALDVLRWIIASNRSCIILDDTIKISEEGTGPNSSKTTDQNNNLITGLENWIQFRFAQGAPDKEQRFMDAVKELCTSSDQKQETLFLWHGSPIYNWHSILREGLHFRERTNGRSYGDGVYLSPQFQTSIGYCQSYVSYGIVSWPHSRLAFSTAISLQEVVNAPSKFVSRSPTQLVVDKPDWIQTRYLFVNRVDSNICIENRKSKPSVILPSDPTYPARGPKGEFLGIPITAWSQSRRAKLLSSSEHASTPCKRTATVLRKDSRKKKKWYKVKSSNTANPSNDAASVQTDVADRECLLSDNDDGDGAEPSDTATKENSRLEKLNTWTTRTDFRVGTLGDTRLPILGAPEYATTTATKLLQQLLHSALRTQGSEPLDELGWYINPSLINTVYQWIVELHTFDPSLPLAKDMKSAGLHSIVLEIRFPADFPLSPPFIRVIRPRFRPFQEGGGGHITIGGAICMELLTNSGWLPTSSIESILLQTRLAISSTDPRPARLVNVSSASRNHNQDYPVGEAVHAYIRACNQHGWKVPDGFLKLGWTVGT